MPLPGTGIVKDCAGLGVEPDQAIRRRVKAEDLGISYRWRAQGRPAGRLGDLEVDTWSFQLGIGQGPGLPPLDPAELVTMT